MALLELLAKQDVVYFSYAKRALIVAKLNAVMALCALTVFKGREGDPDHAERPTELNLPLAIRSWSMSNDISDLRAVLRW